MQTEYQRLYYLKNKEKINERHRKWALKNKDKRREQMKLYNNIPEIRERRIKRSKDYRDSMRLKIFDILGHECVKCGFSDKRALQFDHINGGGHRERMSFNGGCELIKYYSLNPEMAKQRLQVLCANCNWIKKHDNKEHSKS
jgi:hypothetical protein